MVTAHSPHDPSPSPQGGVAVHHEPPKVLVVPIPQCLYGLPCPRYLSHHVTGPLELHGTQVGLMGCM